MLDSDLRKTYAVLFLLGMVLLLAIVPVRYASAEGKEILLVNGNKSEDKTYAIPKRDLAIMMKKLRSYVYEEYGNRGDCYGFPELDDNHTFLPGSFTKPHAKQYITAYIACAAIGAFSGESGVAVFEDNHLVAAFKIMRGLSISTPMDINEDGKDEFLMFFSYTNGGMAQCDFSITEIYNNRLITLYTDVDYYDSCISLEHSEESFSKFHLVKGKMLEIRIEDFFRKISPPTCKSEQPFKLIKERSVLIDVEKQRNTTDEARFYKKEAESKIKYHNNFKPFYSVQVAALKAKESTAKLKAVFAESHYPSFDYYDEEELEHFLLGRFIDRKSALVAWDKLKEKFPEQSAFQQEPVIRYFDGRRWSLSTSNGKDSVKLYFYDKKTDAPLRNDYFKIRSHPENRDIITDRYGYAFSPDGLIFDCSIPIEPVHVRHIKGFSPKDIMVRCGNKERSLSDDSVFVKYRLVDKKSGQAIKGSIKYFLFDKKDKENKVIFEGYTDDEGYALLVNVFVDFTFSLEYYGKHEHAKYANAQFNLVEAAEWGQWK